MSVATYTDVIERSGVAIFIWGNWLDEGSFEATLAFNNLRNPRKLWMGGFYIARSATSRWASSCCASSIAI